MATFRNIMHVVLPISVTMIVLIIMVTLYWSFDISSIPWIILIVLLTAIFSTVVSAIIYYESMQRKIAMRRDIEGIPILNNKRAEEYILREASFRYGTSFTTARDLSRIMSLRVGEEDTEVLAIFAKEDLQVTNIYLAAAISKKNPDDISFYLVSGAILESERDALLRNLANELASKPTKLLPEITKSRNELTGSEFIHTAYRPSRVSQQARKQVEQTMF